MQGADVYALLFGHGNAYYVGHYDSQDFEFTPLGVRPGRGSTRRLAAAALEDPPPPIGGWALSNASGASTAGPAAVLTAVRAAGAVGSLFGHTSTLSVPFYPALNQPKGFAVSFMLQLNAPPALDPDSLGLSSGGVVAAAGTAVVIGRSDMSWGVEWW